MLTGLVLTFMGLTQSNSYLFSGPGFIVSPGVKRGLGAKKKKKTEGGKKGIEKEKKEGSRNKERSGAR